MVNLTDADRRRLEFMLGHPDSKRGFSPLPTTSLVDPAASIGLSREPSLRDLKFDTNASLLRLSEAGFLRQSLMNPHVPTPFQDSRSYLSRSDDAPPSQEQIQAVRARIETALAEKF